MGKVRQRVLQSCSSRWSFPSARLEKSIGDESSSDHEEPKKEKKKTVPVAPPAKPNNDVKDRAQKADEHRLSGNTAFKSNEYQQSIDSYTKSIQYDDNNIVVYMNRALARTSTGFCLVDQPHRTPSSRFQIEELRCLISRLFGSVGP